MPHQNHSLPALLRPIGAPYALLMRARRCLYKSGRLAAYTLNCPTVSVGNIALGGTGKTPLASYLLTRAQSQGVRAVVLTRGYKGKPGSTPLLVNANTPVAACGDEALMLARLHPEASVFVFPQRSESARLAEQGLHPGLCILDDGMQHLAVNRDINIVLLRPDDLGADWGRVLPSGPWREGVSALNDASAFAVKVSGDSLFTAEDAARHRLARYGKPVFFFRIKPLGLRPLFPPEPTEKEADQDAVSGANPGIQADRATNAQHDNFRLPPLLAPERYFDSPYILVSGVGNPAGVARTARQIIGREPVQHFDFADHHAYTAKDLQAVCKLSAAPLPLVCTPKDAVKLAAFREVLGATPVRVLETTPEFTSRLFTESDFDAWWDAAYTQTLAGKTARQASTAPEHTN
ncbi:tetraacyldisaccharide 4'-kinase [Desulfovibrio sp. OttesenSCG-928-G15]|nr:tetraacyldisaccharide 4'-kinase [Desulfovibrio sp. OttesenSCG-928-G15]